MKVLSYYISALFFVVFSTVSFSQNIKVGIGGGFSYIDNETFYTRDVESSYYSDRLGMRNCYTINAKLKYVPLETPFIFTWEFYFFSAATNVDYLGYYSTIRSSPSIMHLDASQDIYSLGFGIELPIIKSFFRPYLSLGVLANYFDKTKIERTPKPEVLFNPEELIISDKLRVGLNFGLGVDYQFLEVMSLDISAKYNFMNLLGKIDFPSGAKEENFNTFSIVAALLYSFNK